ncbi:hypothetical protein [Humibacter sp.]|uniref:hypothetical protein n=1 Tax=Humibacter sp. TaxID=1940291 RepID=UPI003F8179E1
MAREKASINIDIWGDADFRDLTDPAQSLYFKLMSHPKLDYCGVVEFHPGRLAALTREATSDHIMIAAQELSEKFWCVFDQSTDEVLVRGFLRHDGVLLQPRLAVSAAKAYAAVASNKIRAVIVHEVKRFKRENPDLAAWEKPQMKTLLKQDAVDVRETVTDMDWSFVTAYGERYGQRLGQTSVNATTGPTTSTSTSTATSPSSDEDAAAESVSYPHRSPRALHGSDEASMGAIA